MSNAYVWGAAGALLIMRVGGAVLRGFVARRLLDGRDE